jgi:hypothetical protein
MAKRDEGSGHHSTSSDIGDSMTPQGQRHFIVHLLDKNGS